MGLWLPWVPDGAVELLDTRPTTTSLTKPRLPRREGITRACVTQVRGLLRLLAEARRDIMAPRNGAQPVGTLRARVTPNAPGSGVMMCLGHRREPR